MQTIQGTNSGHKELIITHPSKSNPFVLNVIIFLVSLCYLITRGSLLFVIAFGILLILSAIFNPKQAKQIGKIKLIGSIILHVILLIGLGYTLDLNNYVDILFGISLYLSALLMSLNTKNQKNQDRNQQEKKEKNE